LITDPGCWTFSVEDTCDYLESRHSSNKYPNKSGALIGVVQVTFLPIAFDLIISENDGFAGSLAQS
jgi:hypothetical protein